MRLQGRIVLESDSVAQALCKRPIGLDTGTSINAHAVACCSDDDASFAFSGLCPEKPVCEGTEADEGEDRFQHFVSDSASPSDHDSLFWGIGIGSEERSLWNGSGS